LLTTPAASASSAEMRSPSSSSSFVFLLGSAEGRALAGDDQVAGEREPERAGEHVPVRRADRRLADLHDRPEQARKALGPEVPVYDRDVSGELVEAGAGGEDLVVGRAEHDAADALVVAGRLERVDQLAQQLVRERVALVRLVERDGRDTIGAHVVENRLVRHAAEFYYRGRWIAFEEG
jgi:hypothetical protein